MSGLWWLILGLLSGWLIELAIDYRYWRRQAQDTAARLAEREASLEARAQSLDQQQAALESRGEELTTLQTTLAAKDAELLALAKRTDERAEEVTRLEQAMDKRRADLDRMGLTLNEREKDIAARSERLKATEIDVAARLETLQSAEADVTRRVAVVSNRESAMQNWEERILAREHELNDKEADLVRQAATAAELRASLEAMKELVARRYKTPEGDDDLQAIEGIGPEVAELLHRAGIRTFERLSETSLGELTRILEAAGSRFGLADPLSWAEQASWLVQGDYIGFEKLKEALIGGIRRDADRLQQQEASATSPAGAPQASREGGAGNEAGASTAGEGGAQADAPRPAEHPEAPEAAGEDLPASAIPVAEGAAGDTAANPTDPAARQERAFASDGHLFEARAQPPKRRRRHGR